MLLQLWILADATSDIIFVPDLPKYMPPYLHLINLSVKLYNLKPYHWYPNNFLFIFKYTQTEKKNIFINFDCLPPKKKGTISPK